MDCKTDHKNQDNILREIYEKEYSEFVRKNPLFSFTYWKNKDDLRYYNELLNKLEMETKKPLVIPRKIEKLILILVFCASYYNTVPTPNEDIYSYCSNTVSFFVFWIPTRDFLNMVYDNGVMWKVGTLQSYLNELKINPNNYEDVVKYHGIKLRIFNLDTNHCLWSIAILIFDILLYIAIIIWSMYLLYIRNSVYGQTTFFRDCVFLAFSSYLLITFSYVHLEISWKNWQWYSDFVKKNF